MFMSCAGLTVNGASVTLNSGSASYAAIDTGTTLVGGPPDAIAALYAQIPGSAALTGPNAGYYTYRKPHRSFLSAHVLTPSQPATRT